MPLFPFGVVKMDAIAFQVRFSLIAQAAGWNDRDQVRAILAMLDAVADKDGVIRFESHADFLGHMTELVIAERG
jgi:hypothetical protein